MAKLKCLSCSEPFETPEFFSYMMRLRSKTVECLRCQNENYVVPKKGASYFLLLLSAILVGIVIFLLVNFAYALATYNDYDGSFRVGWLPIVGGAFLGLGTARLIMNIFNWMFGEVSQDRKYKSATDYEG